MINSINQAHDDSFIVASSVLSKYFIWCWFEGIMSRKFRHKLSRNIFVKFKRNRTRQNFNKVLGALQIHNTENSKQIFPWPQSQFPHCLRAVYIFPLSVCLFFYRKICGPILGIYKSPRDTWMWKLGLRPEKFLFWEYMNGIFVAVCGGGGLPWVLRRWWRYRGSSRACCVPTNKFINL